jgi:predicted DNA-binding transcriptional regulator AlpA
LEERWLSPEELVKITGHSVNTLAHWRSAGKGPAFLKLSHRIAYAASDVEEWLRSRRVERRPSQVEVYVAQSEERVLALSVQSAREALQRNHRLRGRREKSQSR